MRYRGSSPCSCSSRFGFRDGVLPSFHSPRFLCVPHPSMEGFPSGMQRVSRSQAALALSSISSVQGV